MNLGDPGRCCLLYIWGSLSNGGDRTTSSHRFRVARIPEQRTNSLASEVKTVTEAGPSGSDVTDSSQPGLPTEQRALLGNGGSHTKWPKTHAEKKAEVRARGVPAPSLTADEARVEVQGALSSCHSAGAQKPPTQL